MVLRFFWRDLRRDLTANRGRRLGQALVFARELSPEARHVHVHYLHTPASVVRDAAILTGRTWSFRRTPRTFGRRRTGKAGEDRGRAPGRDLHGAGRRSSHRACRKPPTGHACLSRAGPFPVPLPSGGPSGPGRQRSCRPGTDLVGRARGREEGVRRSSQGTGGSTRRSALALRPCRGGRASRGAQGARRTQRRCGQDCLPRRCGPARSFSSCRSRTSSCCRPRRRTQAIATACRTCCSRPRASASRLPQRTSPASRNSFAPGWRASCSRLATGRRSEHDQPPLPRPGSAGDHGSCSLRAAPARLRDGPDDQPLGCASTRPCAGGTP